MCKVAPTTAKDVTINQHGINVADFHLHKTHLITYLVCCQNHQFRGSLCLAEIHLTMWNLHTICAKVSSLYIPSKQLWIYTGYTYETIIQNPTYLKILKLCNVLVDGEFEIEEKDLRLQFRGSRNQRIIDVQKSISENKIVLWNKKG